MPGTVIGKKMNLGYIGKISRDGDALVINRVLDSDSVEAINFGDAVFLNDDNTVRSGVAPAGEDAGDTVSKFVGIAVATVKQSVTYGNTTQTVEYQKASGVDIAVRGSIIVKMGTGTPVAGGKVYYNLATKAVDAATSATAIELPASFTTGQKDASGGIEITILKRNLI